ncbi:MAG: acyltransferase [Acidobacteria bacterium]|nr:acyltransferase [Acidobacteriota bacterium]
MGHEYREDGRYAAPAPGLTATLGLVGAPRAARYETLDAWRGIACLAVVMYHAVLLQLASTPRAVGSPARAILSLLGTFSIGVPMFFVISGYCIAAAADGARVRGTGIRTYFARRLKRIYPPLWAAMAVAIAVFIVADVLTPVRLLSQEPWMQPRPWWYSPWQWAGNLTLTETWRHHVVGDMRAHFPGQAWTLCYEEQFYILMGLLLFFPRALARGAAAITLFTLAVMLTAPLVGWPIDGFFFDGNWLPFAAGVFVYFVQNYGRGRHEVALGAILVAMFLWVALATADKLPTLGVGAAFALVLLAVRRWDGTLATATAVRPFAWCGRMCYSLYLVHQLPVKAVANAARQIGITSDAATLVVTVPACLAVALVIGYGFYLTVEQRFLNSPARSPRVAAAVPA